MAENTLPATFQNVLLVRAAPTAAPKGPPKAVPEAVPLTAAPALPAPIAA